MWFKLAGATFTNNLGTMDSISKSYMMDYSGLTGLQASPGSVSYATDSTPDATITFTVKSGYVFKSGSTVTASGGASKTYTASADIAAGSSFTMALTGINNKVTFTGAAELVSGGGNTGGGGSEGGGEPTDPTPDGTLITSGSLTGAYYYENAHFNSNEDGGVYVTEGETTNYFFITYIPVQPNTQYRLAKARDTIFVDSNKNKVDRFNINSLDTNWVFTTPANCVYMSTCVNKNDVTDYTTMELEVYNWVEKSTTLLSEIDGVTYREGGISGDSYTDTTTAGYFSYKDIPITAGVRYSIPYARNSWYLDSSKNAVSLINLNSLKNNWTITVPDGVAYISCVFKTADINYTACTITEYELSS